VALSAATIARRRWGSTVDKPNRQPLRQDFVPGVVHVVGGAAAVPIKSGFPSVDISSLIVTISFSILVGGNPVIIGDSSVNPASANGQWITPGIVTRWRIIQARQIYEVQGPLVDAFGCAADAIPFPAWDVTGIYLAGTVNQDVGIILYPEMFV
jgi:hypothetical protein